MTTEAHTLRMSPIRRGEILTNGSVFPSCSCGRWSDGAMTRELAKLLHGTHADDEACEAADAAEQGRR